MFQPKFAASMVIGAATLLIGLSANAHEFIASQSPATAKPGENATLILDSTHQFGLPEEAEGVNDVRATLITADGSNDIAISLNDNAPNLIGTFEVPDTAAWISGHRLGVVWSQTPDGWQAGGADEQAHTADHCESPNMGVVQYLQSAFPGEPAEQAVTGVQKPFDVDGSRQHHQRHYKQRAHCERWHYLSCR